MDASALRLRRPLVALLLAASFGAAALAASEDAIELRLPPDATYSGAEGSPGPVVFSHATHVAFSEQRCVTCHPALFSILQPTRGLAHETMDAGGTCGSCHDGTKASATQDACEHCHQIPPEDGK